MTPTIDIGNAHSRLIAAPEVLVKVRHAVSRQITELPSRAAQAIIKEALLGTRRRGSEADVTWLFSDPARAAALEEAGLGFGDLSADALEATLRSRGSWDGWSSLVDKHGGFPTGLVPLVARAIRLRCHLEPRFSDARGPMPAAKPLAKRPPLLPFQTEASDAFIAAGGRGVIELPPRSGKTRIACDLIARLGLPAIYVTPGVGLVAQTVRALGEFLPMGAVIAVTGGQPGPKLWRAMQTALVWVCTPQTAAALGNIATRRFLILDEYHHAAAVTYQKISVQASEAYFRLGLTGTNYRADGADLDMRGVLHTTVYRKSVSEMVAAGRLVPARVAMVRVPGPALVDVRGRAAYDDGVVNHAARNDLLAWAAHRLAERECRVLCLVREVKHCELFAAKIPGAVAVDGRDNSAVEGALEALAARKIRAVVGTSVIGEGRDVPAADALVYVGGGKSRVKVVQDFFRVLTAHGDKQCGTIVDSADDHHPGLVRNAAQRLALYRREEAFSAEILDSWDLPAWLDGA